MKFLAFLMISFSAMANCPELVDGKNVPLNCIGRGIWGAEEKVWLSQEEVAGAMTYTLKLQPTTQRYPIEHTYIADGITYKKKYSTPSLQVITYTTTTSCVGDTVVVSEKAATFFEKKSDLVTEMSIVDSRIVIKNRGYFYGSQINTTQICSQ